MLHGGAASTGSRWGMGGKTWRAPSDAERAREAQERLARETERRKIQEIQHVERNIQKERELGAKAARINQQALEYELGAGGSLHLGMGYSHVSPRMRSSSFSGIGTSPLSGTYPGLPSLRSGHVELIYGGGALLGAPPGIGISANAALQRERLLSQTRALQAEALRREHRAISMSRERAALALANDPHPPSPRVVNYHNTYNISPRLMHDDGGLGGLEALDTLSLGGTAVVDPVVLDEYGHTGGMPAYAQDFVVTDASLVERRRILRDLGPVEGLSGSDLYASEDDRLNLAISDLTAHAQSLGANAVLAVETGEDVAGQIVVRGVAALLS
ncbi:hypothetical protein JCM3774_004345 [Rhodotorula dairenensis]